MLAFLALSLACVGAFAVISYAAARRTREIGIRVTLGASRSSIVLLLLTQLWWPTVAGLLIGFGAAVPVTELLERDPFYLQTLDLSVHTTVIACMAMTVGIAALYPALRAMRSDPVNALRYE